MERLAWSVMYWTLTFSMLSCFVSKIPIATPAGSFSFANACNYTVWVASLSNAGVPPLTETGFALHPGDSARVATPSGWGGRFWGRTNCLFDSTGSGSCLTGDCGGRMHCDGAGGEPPATLAEFTLYGANGLDFYDVSLVDGYNIPLAVTPLSYVMAPAPLSNAEAPDTKSSKSSVPNYTCAWAGCNRDVNAICPSELRLYSSTGEVVGCKSACEAFHTSEYCCTDAHNTPASCPPTSFSKIFKSACPHAYSYAYDDASSTFTCTGGSYLITFCPRYPH
ncbi:hypothetical protein O6H91_03G001200 [Diphasiastrum complanatum]|uniref:Uncharacterized protein n=2 Tax=Diphasiastrum complanatum TaxID=34168 RepID=A0ACC2E2W0_DIPCM|nr:hypothetical protein O6H91_03G001200 [Diphasiastrum complanatum]KAJ7560825.1 hypothetical protein O6H91_03G001200 [Diphasiastrum complanatum]